MNENESNFLVRRLKQTQNSARSIYTGEFSSDVNLSTYAFLSNAFITQEIVKHKPLGTGLGSYPYEYDKYYLLLKPPSYLLELNQSKINRTDANSLFLRMLGDFGIFALVLFLYFFIKAFKLFRADKEVIKQSTFFYLLAKFIREGHYFPPEFYFFLFLFLKDFDSDITYC
jgi:O-antigen ligase